MRWRWLLLCAPLAALAGSAALGPITFEEIADRAGVHFVGPNGATARKQQPEGLIAGVAVFDYDGAAIRINTSSMAQACLRLPNKAPNAGTGSITTTAT